MRAHGAAVSFVLACAAFAACGEGAPAAPTWDASVDDAGADAGCVRSLPTCPSDPTAIPSYAQTVKAILQQRCVYCHHAGSALAREDFSTQAGIHADFGTAIDQVYACIMPPSTEPPVPPADKTALLTWLVCMAPDN
jgi:hypothetical protein